MQHLDGFFLCSNGLASSQQRLRKNGLELIAQGSGPLFGCVEFFQQLFRVTVVVCNGVGILAVEIVVARLNLVEADLPGDLGFLAVFTLCPAPPVDAALQVLDADRPGHRVSLLACWHMVLVEPDFPGRHALLKEQQVGADGRIGFEHAVGQAHDGVQVALFQQVLFEAGFYAFAEQRAIG